MRRLMRGHVEADKAAVKVGTYNKRLGTRRDPGKPEISTGHPTHSPSPPLAGFFTPKGVHTMISAPPLVIAANQRIARTNLERHAAPISERQPYWSDEEPSDFEIRSAEKRHKDAFDADALVEMVANIAAEMLPTLKLGHKAALGSILVAAYNKHLDEMVEYAVYGRVLSAAAGSVA